MKHFEPLMLVFQNGNNELEFTVSALIANLSDEDYEEYKRLSQEAIKQGDCMRKVMKEILKK